MAYFPDEVIEEVAARNDIADVISSYVKLQRRGSNYVGLCPFHSEKTPSFHVSTEKQLYHCFGCGESGNVFTFLMRYDSLTFPEAVEELASRGGYALPEISAADGKRAKERSDKRQIILEIHKKTAEFYYKNLRTPEGKEAYEYFIKRGLNNKTLSAFGLGYTGKRGNNLYKYLKSLDYDDNILKESGLIIFDEKRGALDRFWNRAMFPIMDANRRVIAFGGRVMGDGKPKYLNSPETDIFDKSRTLYGLYLAKRSPRKEIILAEGYMDVIALHQAGFDNAVATLGTAITSGHANMLKRYDKPIYLCYDSDDAGQKAIARAFEILKATNAECRVIDLSPCKDPDEYIMAKGAESFEERIKEAKNAFIHIMKWERQKYDTNDPGSLTRFQNHLAKELLEFDSEIERNNYADASAKEFNISYESLLSLVNRLGAGMSLSYNYNKKVPSRRLVKPVDGMSQRGKLFLQWMTNPDLYNLLSRLISPEDFGEGIMKEAAAIIYSHMEEKGQVDIQGLVSSFENPEDQKEVSEIFFSSEINDVNDKTYAKAMREIVLRIKKDALEAERKTIDPSDAVKLQEIMDKSKQVIEQIESMDFENILKKG